MKVKIKKLSPEAVIPQYAKEGDAGLDLMCTSISKNDKYIEYHFGLAIEIPEGYVGLLFPRSSITKMNGMMKNSCGIIDSSYRGELVFRLQDLSHLEADVSKINMFKVGDRVAQLLIIPYPTIELEEVENLSETERGESGFGSTGK